MKSCENSSLIQNSKKGFHFVYLQIVGGLFDQLLQIPDLEGLVLELNVLGDLDVLPVQALAHLHLLQLQMPDRKTRWCFTDVYPII